MLGKTRTGLQAMVRLGVGIIGLIVLGSLVFAQGSTAAISGIVRDTSGALVPGVSVTARQTDSGLTRTVVSDEYGGYNMKLLPVGPYEVTTDLPGFKQQVRRGINLVVGQEAVVNLTLEVGAVAEQVTVTEEVALVNTTLSSTSGLITEQQVKDLPLNGRSFDQLLTLNVGISNNTSNIGQGNGWTGFSVAGKRQETNRFLINGVDWVGGNSTGQFITPSGASGQLLGVEAVREYNVLEHTYGAEYGKRAGGQISIVTSSGTNQWHGTLFEYLRNSALDARNFFDQTIGAPPFKRNQFGGAVGGPLKKDKMFVFGNYEGFRQRLALSSRAIVPDLQSRQGLLPCNVISPTPSPCPASGFAPVPNLKPGMLPYANAFWPSPNGPEVLTGGLPSGTAYNYNSALQKAREDFGLARFDYTISNKDSFFANYTMDDGERKTPRINTNFIQIEPLRTQTVGLQETHVFSSTVVNSATVGYARTFATLVRATAVPIPESLLFLPGGNHGSIVIGGGATTVAPAAVAPAEGINSVRGIREYYTLSDDLHFTKGKHSISVGGWLQRIHQNDLGAAQFSAGGVSYPTMLAFLQDVPSQFNLNRNPIGLGYRQFEGAWYIQDEMKLLPNLTARLGLRDEMTDGWNEVAGRCSNYVFDQNFVISTNPVIGKSCLSKNNAKALWQPRVGLSWDPTGTGTWAVRAGFGIHNDLQDNLGNRTYANPPFNAREQLAGSLLSLIPLQKNIALPPTCGPTQPQPCSIYAPAGVDPNMFTPTIQQWNLTVERGLTKDLMLQVAYVGSQSYHTPLAVNANTAPPQVCQNPQGCDSAGTTLQGTVPRPPYAKVPQGATYMPPGTRPNPYVGNGVTWFDLGTSSYHSLNVSLVKRTTRGLTFKTNYTYGKVMDLNSAILAPSAGNEPPDVFSPYNLNLNRGVASYSLQHQFNGNFSYQLPFGSGQRFGSGASGVVDKVIGGWQWNGIVNAQGGFPFTPLAGSNISGTGDANQSDTPSWNPNFTGPVILGKPDQWFDPRAFVMPTAGTFGNVARGSLRGPGLVSFDTSLFKKVTISEGVNLQFRAEAFNVFNHANFSYPNQIVFSGNGYSSSAGVITTTATTSRQIQFALKLMF
jgi:hypothetical protein